MALFENFPYTNFHELNLNWIIMTVKELNDKFDAAISAKISIADPVEWNITKQYPELTIVIDDNSAYLSMQPVPAGIEITNTDYWQKIFDLDGLLENLKDAISINDDGTRTTSTAARAVNSLVWLDDILHRVKADIAINDPYTTSNVEVISIEQWIDILNTGILNTVDTMITNALTAYGDTVDSKISTALNSYGDTVDSKIGAALNTYDAGIQTEFGAVKDLFKPTRKSVILIGDSYAISTDWWTGWIEAFTTNYSSVMTIHSHGEGGSGFKYGNDNIPNFNTQLVNLLATMTTAEKESVTDIVVAGGYNDISRNASEAELITLMTEFKNTALTACPYAKVSVGFCAFHYANNSVMTSCRTYYSRYETASQKAGINFIHRFILVMLNKSLIFIAAGNANSNFHPNTTGNGELAKRIYNYITSGDIGEVTYGEVLFTNKWNVYVHNGVVTIFTTQTPFFDSLSGSSIPASGWVNALDLSGSNLLWFFATTAQIVPTYLCFKINYSSASNVPLPLTARFRDNKVQVGNLLFNSTISVGANDAITLPASMALPWEAVY